jgi:tetratricopeptide (TPR) repeat protein
MILMKNNLAIKKSITEQIANGSIRINSTKEFERLLKLFPSDPKLIKAYADLLSKENFLDSALKLYRKAAILFIDSGSMIDAVVSKIRQWKIAKPTYQDARLFFAALHEANFSRSPLNIFFEKLSSPEMFAIMRLFDVIELPAGQMVSKAGEEEKDLNFIEKGTFEKTTYEPQKENDETIFKKSILMLTKNHFFGKIFPVDKENCSQSYIESKSQAELITISKKSLKQICKKYPNVEIAIKEVYEFESMASEEDQYKRIQKGGRYKLPIRMSLEIYPKTSFNYPIIVEGYSKDISIGGICVVLDEKDMDVHSSIASFHKNTKDAKVKISMSIEALKLKVSGNIVWTQKIHVHTKQTLALGIKFDEMSPKFQGMLFAFADNLGV